MESAREAAPSRLAGPSDRLRPKARAVWLPLAEVIEQRWRARFGDRVVDRAPGGGGCRRRPGGAELPRALPVVGTGC